MKRTRKDHFRYKGLFYVDGKALGQKDIVVIFHNGSKLNLRAVNGRLWIQSPCPFDVIPGTPNGWSITPSPLPGTDSDKEHNLQKQKRQKLLEVKAHQYLYYVKCKPCLTDSEYDKLCKSLGVFDGGGSDRAGDYSKKVKKLAKRLKEKYSGKEEKTKGKANGNRVGSKRPVRRADRTRSGVHKFL